ncbi:MAG: DNRLRE domain-containing protein [Prochloraceae cyanobacterium]
MVGTTLKAGDLAIVGFNFDNPDEFAFVALTNIDAGSEIKFTDNGWLISGGFRSTEGTLIWKAERDYSAGSVIKPSVSGVTFSASGDQILVAQGPDNNPNFLYALNSESNGVWPTDANNSNTSALPTGLTNEQTAVALPEIDNSVYTGMTIGTKTELLAAISNSANWSGSNSTRQIIPTFSLTLTDAVSGGGSTTPTPSPVIAIYEIQGASHTSPFAGHSVTTRGLVTALASNGFYLQAPTGDSNDATSDGIFVFTGSSPTVNVGDSVEVRGKVTEYLPGNDQENLTITQITSPTVTSLTTPLGAITATVIGAGGRAVPTEVIDNDRFATFDSAQDGIDFYESLEGMLVRVNDALAVAPTNRFGEIWVVGDNGINATGINSRGGITISDGSAVNPGGDFNPERIQIDDTLFTGKSPQVQMGARLGNVEGVVSYSFGNYELLPTIAPYVTPGNLSTETTNLVGTRDKLTIASYNVENLDPNDSDGDRDLAEGKFDAIAAHIVNNLQAPDIIALQEIQDNDGALNSTVVDANLTYQALIDAIAAIPGAPQYQHLDLPPQDDSDGGQPGGNIRVGYLYRSDRVSLVPNSLIRIGEGNINFDSTRKSLVAKFEFNGEQITIINNHFASQGGSTPLFGSIQPSINGNLQKREEQAQAVKDYVNNILVSDPNAKVVVLGDLNEFEFNNPLTILKGSGAARLNNLTETLPKNERYTYNFQGNSQALDHMLLSNSLVQGNEYDPVRVNTGFRAPASDHEPILARLDIPPEKFTVIGLPDTQKYSENYPDIFQAQTQWIVDNREALKIKFVSHYGDLVQHGTGPLAAGEYANAKAAMSTLEWADIPHGVVAGNHDVLESGSLTQPYDNHNYLQNFGPQWYQDRTWFGGASSSGLSTYQIFNGGGQNFLALHLDLETPHSELAWAQEVINAHRDKPVMVTTHRYLQDAQDYTAGVPLVSSGRYPDIWYNFEGNYNPHGIKAQDFFNNFIATNRNIFLVNAGHFHEEYRQTSINNHGLPVHEVLADYQDDPNGGNGYLRQMEFDLANERINFKSYSPTLNNFLTKDESQFSLAVDFALYKASNPTLYFQNGVSGYEGTKDTWINEASKNTSYGNSTTLVADDDTTNSWFSDRQGQVLLRFDALIGNAAQGKIPVGATITRANLKLTLQDDIDSLFYNPDFEVYYMTRSWQENSTWNSLGNGLSTESDYERLIARFPGDNNPNSYNVRNIDVSNAVQRWADGEANNGLAIVSQIINGNDDGIKLFASETSQIMFRPALEVEYNLDSTNTLI